MKKVLVATVKPFAPVAISGIKKVLDSAGYELVLLEKYENQEELIRSVEEVDALIVRSDKADKEVIKYCKNLKIIVRAGAGYDNIDLEAASGRGIVVMNTPGQNSNAVAELGLGMMVYIARNCFDGKPGKELKDKTLGIHGYGNVGKRIATIAFGFGMDIYAFDPFIDTSVIENDRVKVIKSVDELYRTCQYISLHIPANDETRESINYDILKLMPQDATLVNTARKEIICEESLLKMFAERNDFKYVSDIAPDSSDKIEKNYPGRYYFTPKKMGAQTAEANINAGIAAASQIVNYFEKGDTTYEVNR
jgi:D-3-phosphoglycerate dehydrogenase